MFARRRKLALARLRSHDPIAEMKKRERRWQRQHLLATFVMVILFFAFAVAFVSFAVVNDNPLFGVIPLGGQLLVIAWHLAR